MIGGHHIVTDVPVTGSQHCKHKDIGIITVAAHINVAFHCESSGFPDFDTGSHGAVRLGLVYLQRIKKHTCRHKGYACQCHKGIYFISTFHRA